MAAPATALVLVAVQAAAQPAPPAATTPPAEATPPAPPETLETPYEDTPPVAPPPAPAPQQPPAQPQPPVAAVPGHIDLEPPELPDTRPRLPIRAERRLALTGEMGWNGLAGFGPVLTYHVHPHLSADLGVGFSLLGWKGGVRARYNLLTGSVTPFLGVGFNGAMGLGRFTTDPSEDPAADPGREPVTIDSGPSFLVQGVLGLDYVHRRGFTLVACAGWSHMLSGGYKVVDGTLTAEEEQGFDIAFRGGLVISLALGYSFQ